jgi:phosphatidylserine/phosphatidylglycerophosphate/cardiolipin synthase-like enzyme
VQIGDSLVEVYFSPAGATAAHLEALVRSARQSIYFLAFSFESGGLADAIIEQASSGLKTAGVMEETQVQPGGGGVYGRFQQAAIDVRLDGNLRNMHHQTLIIDGQIVVTGSDVFNSGAGEENDENTLVIHNPQVAGLYQAEFDRIYAEAIK